MYRDQMNGQMKRLRGMLTKEYGRLIGDQVAERRGAALLTEGNVQVTCARALAHVATALRGVPRRSMH